MKQDILNHFNIKIAGGMEAFGNQLYYGWDKTFFEKNSPYMPIGTWGAFENKGKSGSGGNIKVTDRKNTY